MTGLCESIAGWFWGALAKCENIAKIEKAFTLKEKLKVARHLPDEIMWINGWTGDQGAW